MKEVTIKLPDWAYKYFEDKWPKSKYEEDKAFTLEWYMSWKISELIGDEIQREIAKTGQKLSEVKIEKEIGPSPRMARLP